MDIHTHMHTPPWSNVVARLISSSYIDIEWTRFYDIVGLREKYQCPDCSHIQYYTLDYQ